MCAKCYDHRVFDWVVMAVDEQRPIILITDPVIGFAATFFLGIFCFFLQGVDILVYCLAGSVLPHWGMVPH